MCFMRTGAGGNESAASNDTWRARFDYTEAPFGFAVWRDRTSTRSEAPLVDTRGMRLIFKVRCCLPEQLLPAQELMCDKRTYSAVIQP